MTNENNYESGGGSKQNREDQFAQVVENALTENGELQKLKASMRAMILNVIRDGDQSAIVRVKERNRNPAADLVNQMIMDYFHWYGFQYAIEMFAAESGTIGVMCPNRQHIMETFNNGSGEWKLTAKGGGGGGGGGAGPLELPVLLQIAMNVLCGRGAGEQR